MKGSIRYYIAAVIAIVFVAVFLYASPVILRFAIDSVIGEKPAETLDFLPAEILSQESMNYLRKNLWVCGLGILFFTALSGVASYLKIRFSAMASQSFARRLREKIYHHVNQLPFLYHSNVDTGDLLQRCSSDVETVRRFLESQAVEIGRIFIGLFVCILIMLSLDVQMTLLSISLMPIVVGMAFYYCKIVKNLYQKVTESEAIMSTVIQENLTGIRLVRAFNQEKIEKEKLANSAGEYRDASYEMMKGVSVYWGISSFLCSAQIFLVIVGGSMMVVQDMITIGTLTAFFTYVMTFVWPIQRLGRIMADMGQSFVSMERIKHILNLKVEDEEQPGHLKPQIHGRISFDEVCFSYASGDKHSLHDISFDVKAGETVALIGPTGSGKSTLVNLLPRLLEYQAGSIMIDGTELKYIDRKWIRENIGFVLQEPFLFSRTIRENIHLGSEKNKEEVEDVAKIAAIHNTIVESFQDGYETEIGEKGVTLSGGQKQRIAIARAILRNSPILVFDDSLSALDSKTDLQIQRGLRKRQGKVTTFLISHRISTVSMANKIIVLENGKISQVGTHEQLSKEAGLYKRICNIQNLLENEIEEEKSRDA